MSVVFTAVFSILTKAGMICCTHFWWLLLVCKVSLKVKAQRVENHLYSEYFWSLHLIYSGLVAFGALLLHSKNDF